jgi:hypothetical protein
LDKPNAGAGFRAVRPHRLSRRQFLGSTTALAAALAIGGPGQVRQAFSKPLALPAPEASGTSTGRGPRTARIAWPRIFRDVTTRTRITPSRAGRIELNGGACDGWLRAGDNDDYAIGYYTKKDLAFLGNAAPRWTTCDRYFAAIMAETFPNRVYQHAAQTDRLTNTTDLSVLPTIWDQLAGAGLDGRYYFSDVPVLALWGPKYVSIGRPIGDFFIDAGAGTLPNVAFVDPSFIGEDVGTSNDDHPHADIRNGETFLNAIYRAVTLSPAWSRTVLVFNFDEWGGFFEHVSPPTAPIPPADQAAGNTDGLLGFPSNPRPMSRHLQRIEAREASSQERRCMDAEDDHVTLG